MKWNSKLFFYGCIFLLCICVLFLLLRQEGFEQGEGKKGIDIIYYINLDHRKDRNALFLEEMKMFQLPIERIPGIYKVDQGDLGCSLSHIQALTQFIGSPHTTCIIFEDDFQWIQEESMDKINKYVSNNYGKFDVCLLAGNVYASEPFDSTVNKITACATASGYIVSKQYATALLQNYKEGALLLEQSYQSGKKDKNNQPYAIDQYWQSLQAKDRWFLFNPVLGKQRDSYSDIMGGVVNSIH